MNRRDRLRRQEQMERDWHADQQERHDAPPRSIPLDQQCPAALGRAHDFTMRDRDGTYRCWYCSRVKPPK